ncbi:acylneuraminate cytidylyltransferase family protein [Lysinibacillus sp. FSL R7-0073]|uniref:acylneuraminate cytidylyltransferase family protein n=1 Tax=Lysinibacillus TaxID=400634 RepID=UPI002E2256F7|nr:acylneuraminate cytidylyltransferase family protein [Lysinibacillus fusiformis]
MKVLAIIPARSGSKGLPHKNIKVLNGQPLLTYSIQHALNSQLINRVIVSTDSEEYAKISKQYGAEVPFIRPEKIAGDFALDIETFEHALNYLEETEGYVPDIVVHLRPTFPIRNIEDIDTMISMLINDKQADSVRCIAPVKETPYKMWRKDEAGVLQPLLNDIEEAYNMPRQGLPKVYYQNACVDVIRPDIIKNKKSMTGEVILGYEMTANYDIDTEQDFIKAEQYIKLTNQKNRFVIDIDGVIAQYRADLNYENARPNSKMIETINYLYEKGNEIILFTARGYVTNKDWRAVTEAHLSEWNVKYHELHFGKPNADFYIDDKMFDMFELLRQFSKDGNE